MRKFIVNLLALVVIVVTVILENQFAVYDKKYVTLSLTAVYFIYWAIEFVFDFIKFKQTYPQRYKLFLAELINKNFLSMDIIKANEKKYKKKFRHYIFKEAWVYYVKITLATGVALALIILMCV